MHTRHSRPFLALLLWCSLSAQLVDWIAPELMRQTSSSCPIIIAELNCLLARIMNVSAAASGTVGLAIAGSHPKEHTETYKQRDSCNATDNGANDGGHGRL